MNKFRSRYFTSKYPFILACCVVAGFSFFSSCSKDSGLGANVLPQNTMLGANFKDTTTILTSLVLQDTIPTNGVSTYLLGSYNDPIFGSTKASFYTQLAIPYGNPFGTTLTPGSTVKLDSVVFSMDYGTNSMGEHNYPLLSSPGPESIEIDTINKALVADSAYYSNAIVPHSTTSLGSGVIIPNYTRIDTEPRYSLIFNPRIRIKLNTAWGQHWLNVAQDAVADSLLSSNTIFQRHFSGLYITTDNPSQFPGQGGIMYMNPFSGKAGVYFYYKVITNTSGTPDTAYKAAHFDVTSSCIGFNHYDHDYSNAPFYAGYFPQKDSVYSPNFAYVQGIGGVKTKFTMPYLANWAKKGHIIVNKAEVDIPVNASTIDGNFYAPPNKMYLIGITDTSTVASTSTFTLPDQNIGYYGGTYDAFNHQYVFIITEYMQSVFSGKIVDHGLYFVAGGSVINPNRVVLYGGNNSPKIRLKIYYTPVKS